MGNWAGWVFLNTLPTIAFVVLVVVVARTVFRRADHKSDDPGDF